MNKRFYVLNAKKLEAEAPYTHDWGIHDDCIVYAEMFLNNEAVIWMSNHLTGVVPTTCLMEFVVPENQSPEAALVKAAISESRGYHESL